VQVDGAQHRPAAGQLAPQATAAERGRLAGLGADAGELSQLTHGVEVGARAAPLALLAVASAAHLAARIAASSYSRGYGELAPSRTAVFAGWVACPAIVVTAILPLFGGGRGPKEEA
jgi:hypothetical protein